MKVSRSSPSLLNSTVVVPRGEVEERVKWGGVGDVETTRREEEEEEEGRVEVEESSVMAS